jgi:hypothetical protein
LSKIKVVKTALRQSGQQEPNIPNENDRGPAMTAYGYLNPLNKKS